MNDFLRTMADESRRRAKEARRRIGEGAILRRASLRPVPPPLRSNSTFDVIAEIKPRSPRAGLLESGDAIVRAEAYVRGGAAAISVLTEPSVFGGSLALLREVAIAVVAPVMRKDFLVDPYQVAEARAEGAAGVLLIARLLDDDTLDEMLDAAAQLGLFALIETFDRNELDRAGEAASCAHGRVFVGVNARDLATLQVDRSRFASLAPAGSPGRVVAESGIDTPEDAAFVASLGYGAALVGTALMRAADPEAQIAAMILAGRNATANVRVAR